MADGQDEVPAIVSDHHDSENDAAGNGTIGIEFFISVRAKLAFLLGLASLVVYANTVMNGYTLSDFVVIKNNSIVSKGITAIPEIFSTPILKGNSIIFNDVYRPLSLAMFALEYQVFEGSPFGSHLINILLFAGCVIVLFLFLDALFEHKKTRVAFIAALLFALHPINTEVVASIKNRDQLLCFFFAFMSLISFITYMDRGKTGKLISGSLFFFLSLLSKDTAITMLGIIPLIFFFHRNENRARSVQIVGAAAAMMVIYLVTCIAILNTYNASFHVKFTLLDNALVNAPNVWYRTATAIFILGRYLKLLFIPYPLICDYSFNTIPIVNFANVGVLFSLLAYCCIIFISVSRFKKDHKDPYAFGILFFVVTLSIFSNIGDLAAVTMSETFLFFAAVGFCLIMALLLEKLTSLPPDIFSIAGMKFLLMVLGSICVIYGAMTISRNRDWAGNYKLFSTDLKKAPQNCMLNYDLGTNLLISSDSLGENDAIRKNKLINEGISCLRKAVAIYPRFALAYSELGRTYLNIGEIDSAGLNDGRALNLGLGDVNTMNNLAAVYFKTRRFRECLQICEKAIVMDPRFARGYRNMSNCYFHMEKYDSAIYVLKKAIAIEPYFYPSYQNLAYAFQQTGNLDSARKYGAIAEKMAPK